MARSARSTCFTLAVVAFASAVRIGCVEAGEAHSIDYQKVADGARWGWSSEMASPLYCAGQAGDVYDVHLINAPRNRSVWTIQITKDKKKVYEWAGHKHSVFRILDDRLYYARFHPSGSGGVIVAVDLAKGKQLWESPLRALGGIRHSTYFNSMNLDANYDVVTVYGNEAMGRYFEIKDARAGKTVGHRLFKAK